MGYGRIDHPAQIDEIVDMAELINVTGFHCAVMLIDGRHKQ
jgi:hypothetical protein